MWFIVDDEQRRIRQQPPYARRVPAEWNRLLRCCDSPMSRIACAPAPGIQHHCARNALPHTSTTDSLGTSGVAVVDLLQIRATETTGRKLGIDEAAFRDLYDRTARPLWGYIARATGNDSIADDLSQEAYLRLLRANFEPESEEHAKNYLFRIATNLLRDHFRGAKRAHLPLEHDPGVKGHERQVHLQHDLRKAMMHLKPRERELLWLGHVERFSHKEIAEILGLKAGSIRLLLFRARKKLAALLDETTSGTEEGR